MKNKLPPLVVSPELYKIIREFEKQQRPKLSPLLLIKSEKMKAKPFKRTN